MTVNPTLNYNLSRPNFNSMSWHDETNGNFTVIDALFKAVGLANVTGAWATGTLYNVGKRVVDPITGVTWQAAVSNTSGSGTMAEDIAANPTWWAPVATGVVVREGFITGVSYNVGDFVYQTSEYLAGIVETSFVGGATLRTNIANLGIIYDIKAAMASIAASVSTASGYATATAADRVQTGLDRAQTGSDKTATAADRVQTGLDKAATAADRVQTGLDRVATGNDKTATAADRVQTGLDRVQTGADRTQTGIDAAAAAAAISAAGLPAPAASTFLRRNAGNTAYDARTATQVLADISALSYAAQVLTAPQKAQAMANQGISSFMQAALDDTDGVTLFATLGGARNPATVGYTRLPNGIIIQWGSGNIASGTVSFATTFSNAVWSVVVSGASAGVRISTPDALGLSSFSLRQFVDFVGNTSAANYTYIAIGY